MKLGVNILGIFKPTVMIENIMNISPQEFKDHNIKYVLSDLDNTLVPWNKKERLDDRLVNWCKSMKDNGIQLVIASNNSHDRIAKAVKGLDVRILSRTAKPLPFRINNFIKRNNLSKDSVVMVGDQLMTDIMVGSLTGIRTILVQPLVNTDAKKTRVNRFFEKPILLINKIKYPHLKWRKHLNE